MSFDLTFDEAEFLAEAKAAEEFAEENMPSMNDPGRILFWFGPTPNGKAEVEVLDSDDDKATFWLKEAGFMDYWVRDHVDLELEGFYVLEGVTGHGWKDYFGEYDEAWDFVVCRRASESEIKTEALEDQ